MLLPPFYRRHLRTNFPCTLPASDEVRLFYFHLIRGADKAIGTLVPLVFRVVFPEHENYTRPPGLGPLHVMISCEWIFFFFFNLSLDSFAPDDDIECSGVGGDLVMLFW